MPNYRKNKGLKDLGHYSEWPKVADAVIKAESRLDQGIGHLACMSPQKNERLNPHKG